MPRILVLYGTSEGHTALVANAIGNRLRAINVSADVIDAAVDNYSPSPEQYDGIIIAASVHIGRYQKAITTWVRDHAHLLDSRCNAFVSMSLGVLQHDPKVDADLAAIVARFERETGWHPRLTRFFPGALLYTKYSLVTRWLMKRIAAKAGGDTDTSRDFDYTDWKQVDMFADEFARLVARAA